MRSFLYLVGMAATALYVLNPGAGVFELIPDNLPVVGNLDEAAAVALFLHCWRSWRQSRNPSEKVPSQDSSPGSGQT